jgi:hypothetical protein
VRVRVGGMDTNPYASPIVATNTRTPNKWRISKAGIVGGVVVAVFHVCLHALWVLGALTFAYGPDDYETPGFDRFTAVLGFPLPGIVYFATGSFDLTMLMVVPNIILWTVSGGFIVQWIANTIGKRTTTT